MLIKLSPSELRECTRYLQVNSRKFVPSTTHALLDVSVTEEKFRLSKDCWDSLKYEDKIKLCTKIRKKVHKKSAQEIAQQSSLEYILKDKTWLAIFRRENVKDVESASLFGHC